MGSLELGSAHLSCKGEPLVSERCCGNVSETVCPIRGPADWMWVFAPVETKQGTQNWSSVQGGLGENESIFYFLCWVYLADPLGGPELATAVSLVLDDPDWEGCFKETPGRADRTGNGLLTSALMCCVFAERRSWCHELGWRLHLYCGQVWTGACPGRELQ